MFYSDVLMMFFNIVITVLIDMYNNDGGYCMGLHYISWDHSGRVALK